MAFVEVRQRATMVDLAALYTYSVEGADLDGARADGTPQNASGQLRLLQRPARLAEVLGRVFTRGDEVPPRNSSSSAADFAARTGQTRRRNVFAVISNRIWREYHGAAPDAAGTGAHAQRASHTGSSRSCPMASRIRSNPASTSGRRSPFCPAAPTEWDNQYLSAIGRLKPGVTLEQAQAEVRTIAFGLGVEPEPRGPANAR